MKTLFLSILAALLSSAIASAQTTFSVGLRGGANLANTTVASASSGGYLGVTYSAEKSPIYSWQVGAALEIARGSFALQPALLLSQKGEQFKTTTSTVGFVGTSTTTWITTSRYNWLELPVNLVYTVKNVQFFAGPYWAMAVGGRQKGSYNNNSGFGQHSAGSFDEKIQYGAYTSNRKHDAGVNFGAGYRRGPVQVQLAYGLGMLNLHHIDSDQAYDLAHDFKEDAAYNRTIELTGTYFFKL